MGKKRSVNGTPYYQRKPSQKAKPGVNKVQNHERLCSRRLLESEGPGNMKAEEKQITAKIRMRCLGGMGGVSSKLEGMKGRGKEAERLEMDSFQGIGG